MTTMRKETTKAPVKTRGILFPALMMLFIFTLSGCAVGPDFVKPKQEVPGQWMGASGGKPATGTPAELAAWWRSFDDPVLTSLIDRGIASNLDLKIASERIRQSRSVLREAAGGLYPSLDANARYERSSTHRPDLQPQTGTSSGAQNYYQAGFDASWELDLFGRVRRGVEAAQADVEASREDMRDVLVTLAGDIGMDYLNLRGLQEQLRITRQNLTIQERSAAITRKRYEAGFASALDVTNSGALTATTSAQIPGLELQIRQTIYQLDLLLGTVPGTLLAELTPVKPLPQIPERVPGGLPSDLLQRRPDIRRGEARLHAATARIGVAEADLFPRFTLNGAASIQAADLVSWSSSVTRLLTFGPSVSMNLFNGGATRARIEENRSLADQAFLEYRSTILTALEDVESAWVAFDKEDERSRSLMLAVENNRRSVDLAGKLYAEGQSDFLTVLDAERSLYSAEAALAQSRSQTASHLVSLYKALGGGWQDADTARGIKPVKP